MTTIGSVLMGAVAMASFVAALFFLRYWRQTHDSFFLLFAIAFAVDSAARLVLGMTQVTDEAEPLFYLARLASFSLILFAIVQKNRPKDSS